MAINNNIVEAGATTTSATDLSNTAEANTIDPGKSFLLLPSANQESEEIQVANWRADLGIAPAKVISDILTFDWMFGGGKGRLFSEAEKIRRQKVSTKKNLEETLTVGINIDNLITVS